MTESSLNERKIKVQSVIDRLIQFGDQYDRALSELNEKFSLKEINYKPKLNKNASIRS